MTTIVKAFVSTTSLIDNGAGRVSVIGELSDYTRTFSTDKREYSLPAFPDHDLTIFYCMRDGLRINLEVPMVEKILTIANSIDKVYDGSKPGREFLKEKFPELINPQTGDTIVKNGRQLLESFTGNINVSGELYELEIWFADAKMREDYIPFEIKIVPPVQPIAALYNKYEDAIKAMQATNIAILTAQEEAIRGQHPFTFKRVFELKWVDPTNPTKTFNTYWTVLCYGPNANRVDNILNAIREYVTTNSSQTIEEWRNYFPDILTTENFVFIPLWDQTALSAGPGLAAVFSPITRLATIVDDMSRMFPSRDAAELMELGETVTHIWNGIMFYVLPGTGNPIERGLFSVAYPDYCVLNVNDQNLAAVSAKTRSVISALEKLVILADEYTSGSMVLPNDINENFMDGSLFLESTIDGMALRVMTRDSYNNRKA
jgi:hypothetical protein